MKSKLHVSLLALGFAVALFPVVARAQLAPDKPTVPADPNPSASPAREYNSWDDIKTLTYQHKAEFTVGLSRIQGKLDSQIAELKDKRTKMNIENHEWDFAMRNLDEARSYLKSTAIETDSATSETWNSQKEKLSRAFQSIEEDLANVRATTTL